MPIDDNNVLINQGSRNIDAAAAIDDLTPPQYGEHQFDQLYSDIDPSGYATPVGCPSGMSTPFQSRSRSVSSENLTSLIGVASSDFAANALQSRLNSLDMAGANRTNRDRTVDRSQLSSSGDGQGEHGDVSGTSLPNSLPHGCSFSLSVTDASTEPSTNGDHTSRRASEEDNLTPGAVTPQHIEYSAESLAKVPSYTTALKSQTRTPINSGLPTYQSATCAYVQTPAMPRMPGQSGSQLSFENHRGMLRRCS